MLAISVSVSVSLYVSALIGYGQLGLLSAAPSTALFTPDRSIVQWPFIVIGSLIAIASSFRSACRSLTFAAWQCAHSYLANSLNKISNIGRHFGIFRILWMCFCSSNCCHVSEISKC